MKTNFLLTTLLFGSVVTHAQMTLNSSSSVFSEGTHLNLQQNNNPFDECGAGANQIWDFSTFSGSEITTDFANCSVAGDCGSFGNANIISYGNGSLSNGVAYYHVTNNVVTNTGLKAQGVNFYYTDPEDLFRFPFSYGNTYTDHFMCNFYSGSNFIREGNTTVTADAYGTLKLPSGTYTNALRLHMHQVYSDSLPDLQMVLENYISDVYTWYVPGLNTYIFSISNLDANGIMTAQSGTYNTAVPSVTGINNVSAESVSLKLFPNPAGATLNINVSKNDIALKNGNIYDIVGKRYELPIISSGRQSISFNTASLSNGIYYVQVETSEGMVNKKFEIMK